MTGLLRSNLVEHASRCLPNLMLLKTVTSTNRTKSQEASTLSQRLPEGLAFGKETAGSKIPLLGRLSETKGYMAHATLAASPSVSHERTNKDNKSSKLTRIPYWF